jgi:hypothetical protein
MAVRVFADPFALTERDRIENAMRKFVRYEVDLDNLPPLTAEQRAEIEALSEMPDSEIDYSDVPPLGDSFWRQTTRRAEDVIKFND